MKRDSFRVPVPNRMLEYNFPLDSFNRGPAMSPDFISVDSGSTDSGLQELALGSMTCTRSAYTEKMEILIQAELEYHISVLISSVDGNGTNQHMEIFTDIAYELAHKDGWRLNMVLIYMGIDKGVVRKKLGEGKIQPCGPVNLLTAQDVDDAAVIVVQVGTGPYLKVLQEDPEINLIISGRSYGPTPMTAMAPHNDFPAELAWYMGKILECGGLCTESSSRYMVDELHQEYFDLIPLGDKEHCTPYSVAAHTLYEKTHPYLLPGPGGMFNLSSSEFEPVTEKIVRVNDSQLRSVDPYTVKLEGTKCYDYHCICVAGIRDPILVSRIDSFLDSMHELVNGLPTEQREGGQLIFHVYGKNGVMGDLEPNPDFVSQELRVIVEIAAPTPQATRKVRNHARIELLHSSCEGRMATSGNIGLPFTPPEIPLDEAYAFNVYHLMQVDDPAILFPTQYTEVK